jgi:hypothetical protein
VGLIDLSGHVVCESNWLSKYDAYSGGRCFARRRIVYRVIFCALVVDYWFVRTCSLAVSYEHFPPYSE